MPDGTPSGCDDRQKVCDVTARLDSGFWSENLRPVNASGLTLWPMVTALFAPQSAVKVSKTQRVRTIPPICRNRLLETVRPDGIRDQGENGGADRFARGDGQTAENRHSGKDTAGFGMTSYCQMSNAVVVAKRGKSPVFKSATPAWVL